MAFLQRVHHIQHLSYLIALDPPSSACCNPSGWCVFSLKAGHSDSNKQQVETEEYTVSHHILNNDPKKDQIPFFPSLCLFLSEIRHPVKEMLGMKGRRSTLALFTPVLSGNVTR